MVTQIRSCIGGLLAACGERQDNLYGKRKFWWTLMRHFLAVRALASGMREATVAAGLVAPPRLAHRTSAGTAAAVARTAPIPAVARTADEEHLPALGQVTEHEAERVHVPGGAGTRKLDTPVRPCDDESRRTGPRESTRGTRSWNSGSLLPPGVGFFSLPRSAPLREFRSRAPRGTGSPGWCTSEGDHPAVAPCSTRARLNACSWSFSPAVVVARHR
jgi:hypothetical protein